MFLLRKNLLNVLNERDKFLKKFIAEELLAIILLALMFLTVSFSLSFICHCLKWKDFITI